MSVPNLPDDFRSLSKEEQRAIIKKRGEDITKSILSDHELFEKITIYEFDKKIVGELESRQTIFLCIIGGLLVENASSSAYNLMINSKSGAGKDFVTKNVLKILPKNKVESKTRISPTAFTYWKCKKYNPDWSWDGKVCYLADISNNILNHEVFKLMCTEGSSAVITVNNKAEEIEIEGTPCLIITIAGAYPNDEMLRRFPIVELDESKDQTKAIMQRQAIFAVDGISSEYDPVLMNAIGNLKRVKIKVPYATRLVSVFSDGHVIMRTHFGRLIDYIKASAALHQHQREVDSKGEIIADELDYEIARIAMIATTSNPLMVPLTKSDKRLLDLVKNKTEGFSVGDIIHQVTWMSEKSLYVHLAKLADLGFFDVDKEYREGVFKPVTIYKYKFFEVSIPTWEEICRISTNTLDGKNASTNTNTSKTSGLEPVFEANEVNEVETLHEDEDHSQKERRGLRLAKRSVD